MQIYGSTVVTDGMREWLKERKLIVRSRDADVSIYKDVRGYLISAAVPF